MRLEVASNHKSANTHSGNVIVTRGLLPFDTKINGLSGAIMEHFCVTFRDPSLISVRDIVRIKHYSVTAVSMGNEMLTSVVCRINTLFLLLLFQASRHRFSGCLRNLRFDGKIPVVHPRYFAVSQCDEPPG